MDFNLIIQIVSVCWLWVNITPIQTFILMRNWGYLTTILTCHKCLSLWTGLIVCLVLYIVNGTILNPVNAILDKIINYYERN
jgi:hypothetical protein